MPYFSIVDYNLLQVRVRNERIIGKHLMLQRIDDESVLPDNRFLNLTSETILPKDGMGKRRIWHDRTDILECESKLADEQRI
jgi:hypothetical protein